MELPSTRFMRAVREIKSVGGSVALGAITIHFENQEACQEFVAALAEFRIALGDSVEEVD